MKRTGHVLLGLLIVSAGVMAAAPNKELMTLFQDGLYQEQTAGDLDKAIEIYQKVIADAGEIEKLAAKATFQLGMCHLKKDDKTKAIEYFRKVVTAYPAQKELVANAKKQLEQIAPQGGDGGFLSLLPDSVLDRLSEIFSQLCTEAVSKQMMSNSHIYFVDTAFNCYNGGFNYFMNRDTTPTSGTIDLGSTTLLEQTLFDITGKRMNVEFVKQEHRPNFYRIVWTPEAPITSFQIFPYAWSNNQESKLTSDGTLYRLKMHNDFGNRVMEEFYLVLPDNINLISPSERYTGRESLNGFTIYSWKKEVPENTGHTVTVKLAAVKEVTPEALAQVVKDAVEIISTCAETDPKIKDATESLAGLDCGKVVMEICKHLDSTTDNIRRAALYTLWQGGLPDITAAEAKLIELCSHTENTTRGMAALALSSIKTPASLDAIKKMAEDTDGYARRCAVYALGLYGDATALPVVEKALQDQDPQVKGNAQAAMTMLNRQKTPTAKPAKPDKLRGEDLAAEGWKLWQEKKMAEAENKFEEAVAADPTNDNAYQGLGWAQQPQGKKQNAEASFKKCIELNPKNAAALNGLGWIAFRDDRKDEAIAWWEKAVKAEPGATAALAGLTQAFMEKEDYQKAARYFMLWLKVEPNNQDAKDGLKKAKQAMTTNK